MLALGVLIAWAFRRMRQPAGSASWQFGASSLTEYLINPQPTVDAMAALLSGRPNHRESSLGNGGTSIR
jgi:hypothetical protein